MKEVIAKLERILELTSTHGITLQPENKPATSDDQLMYVESKIRLNAIQALDIFDKNNIERQKPRTKTEFVRCEFKSDKEKAEAFIEGGLRYFTRGAITGDKEKDTIPVTRLDELLCGASIYRKVETEIDERQEFIDRMLEMLDFNEGYDGNKIVSDMYDNFGFRFKLVEK